MSLEPDLTRIATLSDPELRGWWWAVMILRARGEEPGEREMLHSRARALGVDLSQVK